MPQKLNLTRGNLAKLNWINFYWPTKYGKKEKRKELNINKIDNIGNLIINLRSVSDLNSYLMTLFTVALMKKK